MPPERAAAAEQRSDRRSQAWAVAVMRSFGLDGWRFQYNRRLTSMGLCHHGLHRIELSIYLAERNPLEEVLETLKHEICHALVGPRHGHDAVWKSNGDKVGCNPERCGQADMPEGRWRAVCNGCGATHDRHRRPSRPLFCRGCGLEKGKLTWASS